MHISKCRRHWKAVRLKQSRNVKWIGVSTGHAHIWTFKTQKRHIEIIVVYVCVAKRYYLLVLTKPYGKLMPLHVRIILLSPDLVPSQKIFTDFCCALMENSSTVISLATAMYLSLDIDVKRVQNSRADIRKRCFAGNTWHCSMPTE